MCVDCVLALLRIAQADPGRRTPPRGGSVTVYFVATNFDTPGRVWATIFIV
jgi:hypothetical protein